MRYLLVHNHDFNNGKLTGAHRRFLELVKYLAQNNEVLLVSRHISELDGLKNIKYFKYHDFKIPYIPKHIGSFLNMFASIPKNIKYDYAISFSPVNTCCMRIKGCKKIVSMFREDLIGYQRSSGVTGIKLLYFIIQEKLAIKASDLIIVQCKNDKDNLISRSIKTIPDIEKKIQIQINNANASWMNTYNINRKDYNDGITRILFIGDFSNNRKGHDILLPAVKKLLDNGYKIKLFAVGDGIELSDCRKRYSDKNIIFPGRILDMEKYLSIADFLIVPSRIDSCPNTVLEGLNAGIAVYGADSGGIPDLLSDNKYLFKPTVSNIYEFLKNIIDNKSYIQDAKDQIEQKDKLTFNWGELITNIIVEKVK